MGQSVPVAVGFFSTSSSPQTPSVRPHLQLGDPLGRNSGTGIVSFSFTWLCSSSVPYQNVLWIWVSRCSTPTTFWPSSTAQISPKMSWQLQATPICLKLSLKRFSRILESNYVSTIKSQTCSSRFAQFIQRGTIKWRACLSKTAISRR